MSGETFADRYFPPHYFPDGQFGARGGAAAPPATSPRGDISTMLHSQYGGINRRRVRKRLPTEAEMRRVFMVALLADQQVRKKRA